MCLFYYMLQMQHSYGIIYIVKNQVLYEEIMKKLLSLAILISLTGYNGVLAKSSKNILNAGAQQNINKYDKYNGKYNFRTNKITPVKNKYEYINLAWWSQFNDEYLNDYIIRAIENNKDLKIAS